MLLLFGCLPQPKALHFVCFASLEQGGGKGSVGNERGLQKGKGGSL